MRASIEDLIKVYTTSIFVAASRGELTEEGISTTLKMLADKAKEKEQPTPSTKTEYVKCDFDNAWECYRESECGGFLFIAEYGNQGEILEGDSICCHDMGSVKISLERGDVYRKVEKEIDWDDEAIEFLNKNDDGGDWNVGSRYLSDLKMIKFCRLVESLTRHIEVE